MRDVVRWTLYGFLAALAAAIVIFPTPENYPPSIPDPVAAALHEMRSRWVAQSEVLRRAHSRDLARIAAGQSNASSNAGRFTVVSLKGVPASFEAGVRKSAEALFANMPMIDSSVRVVFVLTLDTARNVEGVPAHRTNWQVSSDVFLPDPAAGNTCAIVVRAMHLRVLTQSRVALGADPCYWYKVYGLPGRGIAALIDSTRGKLIADNGGSLVRYLADSRYFNAIFGSDVRMPRCAQGDRSVCASLIAGAGASRYDVIGRLRTPGWIGSGRYYSTYADLIPATLLRRIEREAGTEEFLRIWKSDAPLAVSFAQVRGEALDEWIHDWISSKARPTRSGPMPTVATWVVVGIGISGLIALGAYGASRRTDIA